MPIATPSRSAPTQPRNRVRIHDFRDRGDAPSDLIVRSDGHVPQVGDVVSIITDDDPDYSVARFRVDHVSKEEDRNGQRPPYGQRPAPTFGHRLRGQVIQRTPRVDVDSEPEPEDIIRNEFVIPECDDQNFNGIPVQRIAGIALDVLARIAATDGVRGDSELRLVSAYHMLAANPDSGLSEEERDSYNDAVVCVRYLTNRLLASSRTVRRPVSGEEPERHFALAHA